MLYRVERNSEHLRACNNCSNRASVECLPADRRSAAAGPSQATISPLLDVWSTCYSRCAPPTPNPVLNWILKGFVKSRAYDTQLRLERAFLVRGSNDHLASTSDCVGLYLKPSHMRLSTDVGSASILLDDRIRIMSSRENTSFHAKGMRQPAFVALHGSACTPRARFSLARMSCCLSCTSLFAEPLLLQQLPFLPVVHTNFSSCLAVFTPFWSLNRHNHLNGC